MAEECKLHNFKVQTPSISLQKIDERQPHYVHRRGLERKPLQILARTNRVNPTRLAGYYCVFFFFLASLKIRPDKKLKTRE